ncbi:MAG: RnfABCDGE type electron transport complex subunit G [Syntrophaceae bacterium]|nr:RnfABCDGE type electron transport complex subunit G [Syntrophaceae bacterium]
MREFIQLAGILTLVSVLSGWALSYTYTITKPIIEVKRHEKKVAAIAEVLPAFNNQPEKERVEIPDSQGNPVEFFVGKKDGTPTGVAFRSATVGYGGKISLMIGLTPEGKVYGLRVLDQNETPGLGNKIAQESYTKQFLGKELASSRWEVKKAGGDFDQITAATVSSRAITKGIREGLALYQANAEKILKAN